jgi:hypothetical protein
MQIFQQQCQTELVGNAILEQELEEWRHIQREVSGTLLIQRTKPTNSSEKIKNLQAEVQKWQDQHAKEQSEWDKKRRTGLVHEQAKNKNTGDLEEAKWQVNRLQQELQGTAHMLDNVNKSPD